jgi:hypothetical protein
MTSLLAMVFVLGGHWLVGGFCCYFPAALARMGGEGIEYVVAYQVGGTPPAVFGFVPFGYNEQWWNERNLPGYVAVAFFGLMTWLVVAVIIGRAALDRFAQMTNRGAQDFEQQPPPMPGAAA